MPVGSVLEIKTVVVGDTDAGKTSLAERFCYGEAPVAASPTIGASFLQKLICLRGVDDEPDINVVLQVWDTAGQERFRSMAPMYYRGATAAVIVFDLTKDGAWDNIDTWRSDLVTYAEAGIAIGVAGNKSDLTCASHYDLDVCKAMCQEWGASFHVTSALTGEGVEELFTTVAKRAANTISQQRQSALRLEGPELSQPHIGCC